SRIGSRRCIRSAARRSARSSCHLGGKLSAGLDHCRHWFTPRTEELPAREAADILGHSRVSQTTDTYVRRNLVSRHAAAVLDALGKRAEKRQHDQKIKTPGL